MDAAEYKHVVLGLIFLKYISDSFQEHHAKLVAGEGEYAGANPEDPDEYRAENIFWVPPAARWTYLQNSAKQPTIGKIVDDAMVAIERDNPRLKGILPKDYARPALDKNRLGELIDLIGTIGMGNQASRSKDILGRVYEYFLSQFASAEGKKGGQFYTPQSVVRLLVEMLAPYKGRIYDPCCGSGGMFVQSEKFVEAHGGKLGDISIYGQESNATTRRLAMMNLAIRGIEADLVDCMVALPGHLFYSTQIPVCLWFLSKNKSRRVIEHAKDFPECFRDRKRETLFIDARKTGTLVDRVHRQFNDADISKIADTYH